jgi:putative transposase
MSGHRTYVFRLYPTKAQASVLEFQLSEACRLYNGALQERRDAYRMAGKTVTYNEQGLQLKDIRAAGDLGIPCCTVAEDVLKRVDRAFQSFFRRVKARDGRAGYPRFRSARRYDSLTYRRYLNGVRRHGKGLLYAYGIGRLKFKEHRQILGDIRAVTIKRAEGRWFVHFIVDNHPVEVLPPSGATTGIDVGLTCFATFSDGEAVANPRHFREAERRLRRAQRRAARRTGGSIRRRKAAESVARVHASVRRQRADFHHKLSSHVVSKFGLIAVENLNVKGLAGGILAKSVHDAGWSSFINMLTYKAESAGRVLVKVDPRGTSQTCPCGTRVPKALKDRWHQCDTCGLSIGRDHAAAINILALGRRVQASNVAMATLA